MHVFDLGKVPRDMTGAPFPLWLLICLGIWALVVMFWFDFKWFSNHAWIDRQLQLKDDKAQPLPFQLRTPLALYNYSALVCISGATSIGIIGFVLAFYFGRQLWIYGLLVVSFLLILWVHWRVTQVWRKIYFG